MPNNVVFICIGTNKLAGDCFGPIVGTYLKCKFSNRLYKDIEIYGDIYKPVDYNNINYVLNSIKNKNCTKILVDAALGESVGSVIINSGGLCIGEGIFKSKKIIADINIKGIVGKNYDSIQQNMIQLRQIDLCIVKQMANYIVNAIEI